MLEFQSTAATKFTPLHTLFIIAMTLGLTALNYQAPISIIEPGLDQAWAYTLNYLHSNNLLLGRDHFFTFGPLGYLEHTRGTAEKNINESLYFWLVIIAAMNASLLVLARLCSSNIATYLFNLAIATGIALCLQYAGMKILLLIYCLTLIYWITQKNSLLIPLAALTVSAGCMKFSYAVIACTLLLGISLSASVQQKKITPLICATAALLALYAFFWIFIANGSIHDGINYLLVSLEISRGHAASMTVYPANSTLLVIALIALSGLLIQQGINPRTKAEYILFIAWCAVAFIWFKYAFSRQDSHHLGAYFAFVFYVGALFVILRPKAESWYIAALVVVSFFCWQKIHSSETQAPELFVKPSFGDKSYNKIGDSKFYSALEALNKEALQPLALSEKMRAAIGTQTTAIYPWENTIAAANQLNWRPMPVIQQYIAYTPLLDQKNADFFNSASAPEFVIWHHLNQQFAIDDRHFLSESPQTTTAILQNYQKQSCDEIACLWQKRSSKQVHQFAKSESFTLPLNERIAVPKGEMTKLNINVQLSALGKLASILWQPPRIRIDYQLENGTSSTHRLLIENAKHGVWINPYIAHPAQVSISATQVTSVSIVADAKYFAQIDGQWLTSKTLPTAAVKQPVRQGERPNFLFVITDDQSWEHTAKVNPAIKTPTFSDIANNGLYFHNAFANTPSCTASRGAILTGRPFWQLEDGAQLWGLYDGKKFQSYQQILKQHDYRVGYTGKGWGPGKTVNGDPLGKYYNYFLTETHEALTKQDLVSNFNYFLDSTDAEKPFSFWVGPTEPHRPFISNVGSTSKVVNLDAIRIPKFLPDHDEIRRDLADYIYEIQWFDRELAQIIQLLKDRGLYENTVIVYTSDNGMPFPRSKATLYHHGTRVPLAIQWGSKKYTNSEQQRFVNLIDIAPTFLELAGIPTPEHMVGNSLAGLLNNKPRNHGQSFTVSGRERHIYNARQHNRGYPARAIYTDRYVYIYNFEPELKIAGDEPTYEDIDNGSPSKALIVRNENNQFSAYKKLITSSGAREELYDLENDPDQIDNLADHPDYQQQKDALKTQLFDYLSKNKDPRVNNNVNFSFDDVPYYK